MTVGLAQATANAILDAHHDVDYPWMQLHIGDPGADGTANIAGNATRVDISGAWAPAAGGSKVTDVDIEWTDPEVDTSEDYTHCSYWSAASAGTFGSSGTVTAEPVDATGEAFRIPAGSMSAGFNVAA